MNSYELTPLKILVFPLVGPSLRVWAPKCSYILIMEQQAQPIELLNSCQPHRVSCPMCFCPEETYLVGIFVPAECASVSLVIGLISSTSSGIMWDCSYILYILMLFCIIMYIRNYIAICIPDFQPHWPLFFRAKAKPMLRVQALRSLRSLRSLRGRAVRRRSLRFALTNSCRCSSGKWIMWLGRWSRAQPGNSSGFRWM